MISDRHCVVAHGVHQIENGPALGFVSDHRVAPGIPGIEQENVFFARLRSRAIDDGRESVKSADRSTLQLPLPADPWINMPMQVIGM